MKLETKRLNIRRMKIILGNSGGFRSKGGARSQNKFFALSRFLAFFSILTKVKLNSEFFFINCWYFLSVQVLKRFPESLQADVCLHLHKNLFAECGVFKSATEGCRRALALRFKIRHYLPGHFIIKQGDEVKRLYFIAKGNIEVVKSDETMLTLG